MTVKLLRDARIRHKSGEIVTVSPEEANFLVSTGSAMEIAVNLPKAETAESAVEKPKRTVKKK